MPVARDLPAGDRSTLSASRGSIRSHSCRERLLPVRLEQRRRSGRRSARGSSKRSAAARRACGPSAPARLSACARTSGDERMRRLAGRAPPPWS